ncbi:MAG TPA: hypothetical protein PLZ51_00595, partial [Aggregatilineales bacterium]|nr:hypothetical protein [Aggregatilineales bacterium]
ITPEPTVDVTPEPTVDVTPDVTPEPTEDVTPVPLVLDSSLVCSAEGMVTFTVFVLEGAMGDEGYEVQVSVNGEIIYTDYIYGLNMDNPTATFELGYYSGQTVTFTVVGLDGLTKTVECWDNSNIVVEGTCVDGVPTFYVLNYGAPMTGEVAWYLMDANNNVLTTGAVFVTDGETTTLTFPEYSDQQLYLEVDQRPGFVGDDYSYAVIDACFIPTEEPTEEPTVDVTPEPTVDVTPEPTPTNTPDVTPEPTPTSTPDVTPEPTPTNTPDVTPEPTPTSTPEPIDFVSSVICLNNGNATFTVTYTGTGSMAQGESYAVSYTTDDLTDDDTDDQFTVIGAVTRLSQSKPTATFTVRRMSGETITFVVEGLGALTATIDCWDKSSVSVDGACVDGVPTFYVNNTGSEAMTGDTTWRLIDEQTGTILTSGTIRLGGKDTQLLTFEEYAGLNIRLIVDQRPGHPGNSQPNASLNNCANS